MIKPKNAYRIIGLVLFALFLSWLTNFLAPAKPREPGTQELEAYDYSITNLHTQKFGSNGKLIYRLNAQSLRHFPEDDTSLLEKPFLLQYSNKGDIVETTADQAVLRDQNKTIEMRKNVVTVQKTRSGKVLARANSQQLIVQLQ
jgi:lipopolysaccharide export system protein LptC